MRRGLAILLLLSASAGAFGSRAWLEQRVEPPEAAEELLYLPNGKHLRMMSLGHGSLLADWIYIWSLQYYSNYERQDRYRYVEHIFGDVIAELDPHYIDAYWMGALIMIVEGRDLEGGLRLLEKGAAANPESWILPYLAGWECYRAEQVERSVGYFNQAAETPGAPVHVRRMQAGVTARSGEPRQALAIWQEVLADPQSDSATRALARRKVAALQVTVDLENLDRAIQAFRTRTGRPPRELGELRRSGVLTELPADPEGKPYRYDPLTGEVSTGAGRVLGSGT
ncbi:hypothetical protein ABI59_01430 [Acidobacteria bacterium Mor1]|nr:hypothetical protein ABI59_01430 [Acidobacteria bacterium Mor1]